MLMVTGAFSRPLTMVSPAFELAGHFPHAEFLGGVHEAGMYHDKEAFNARPLDDELAEAGEPGSCLV